jgi:hypothetical protein
VSRYRPRISPGIPSAGKIYWVQHQIDRAEDEPGVDVYRQNVRLHTHDPFDA